MRKSALRIFGEQSGQVVDIADLEILAAFGFPLVAIAVYRGGVELRADGNTCGTLENAGKTQGLGIAPGRRGHSRSD